MSNNSTARLIRQDQLVAFDNWDKLPPKLQGLGTRVVLIGPDGYLFDLSGPQAGRQGVRLAKTLQGEHHWPFELLITEGAYQVGVTIERTNYKGRIINAGVTIGGHNPPMTEFQYRWADNRFWGQMEQDKPSWLGVYTRFTGWRWTQVRLRATVDTAQSIDVTAFGNNTATEDVTFIAEKPYYAKRMKFETWDAQKARLNPTDDDDGDPTTGMIALANCGDLPSCPIFLVVGAGDCSLQDGTTDMMVPLPKILSTDGYVIANSDPEEITLVSSKDPVDNLFYARIRASKILEAFLHNLADRGERIDLRMQHRFHSPVPPGTVAHIRVKHDNPHAQVTAFMPQHFKRSR